MPAAAKSSAPYCWTLPVCTVRSPLPLLLGEEAGAVHGSIDDGLVDVLVDPAPVLSGPDADGVHDGVDHVLVEPVARALAIGFLMPYTMTFS